MKSSKRSQWWSFIFDLKDAMFMGWLKGGSKGEGYLRRLCGTQGRLGEPEGVVGSLKLPAPLGPTSLKDFIRCSEEVVGLLAGLVGISYRT